jgi:hypothetical protein
MTVRIGCHETHFTRFANGMTGIGHSNVLTDARVFCTASENPPSGTGWARTSVLSNQGIIVHVSYKSSNSWANIANGADDTKATNIGNFLNALPVPGYIGFHHEASSGQTAADGPAYQAAFNRVIPIIKARAPAWRSCSTYVGGVFWFGNGGGPAVWWPSSAEVLGCDTYDTLGAPWNGTPYMNPNSGTKLGPRLLLDPWSGRTPPLTFARSKGVPLIVPELGIPVENPATNPNYAAYRSTWMQGFTTAMRNIPDFESITYYERDSITDSSNTVNWAISGGGMPLEPNALEAYFQLSQGASALPPLVSSFTPTSGIVGTAVTITGSNFTGATSVRFNGVVSAYTVLNPTTITATVPTGATTGPIRVQSVAGFDDSNPFTVGALGTFLGSVSPATRVKAAS